MHAASVLARRQFYTAPLLHAPVVLCACRFDFEFERQSAAGLPLPGEECSSSGSTKPAAAAAATVAGSTRPGGLHLPRLTAAQRERLTQQQMAQL